MERENLLTDHYLLYLDLLGFTYAVGKWENARVRDLIGLLRDLSAAHATLDIRGERMPDGGFRFIITPEFSTFSDLMVASYPQPAETPENVLGFWAETVLEDARRIAAMIADAALRLPLLIRGGLAFGGLLHGEGVVIGQAMIDAYHLESRVAVYPRIAVAQSIVAMLPVPLPKGLLLQDEDGIFHLDYFAELVRRQPAATFPDWLASTISAVEASIAALDSKEAGKWVWFKSRLLVAVEEHENS